jgi:hypothetical protein
MPEDTEEKLKITFSNPVYTLAELKAIFSDLDWLGRYATDIIWNDYEDYEPPDVRRRPRLPSLTVSLIRSGSLIMEIVTNFGAPAGSGLAILALLNRILKHGPEAAALPHRMRQSWYAAAHDAEVAKQKLLRLRRYAGTIETDGPDLSILDSEQPPAIRIAPAREIEGTDSAS